MKLSYLTYVVLFVGLVLASPGDRLITFRNCVSSCEAITCNSDLDGEYTLPFYLRLLLWDCSQNCDYKCQRFVTNERLKDGLPVLQFHGKWPFYRFYGIQEPASVLFSILNLIPHLQGLLMISRSFKDEERYGVRMRRFYIGFSIVGMNAWIWSSVFHTRDFIFTERLDYFSAGLTILYGFYTAVVRICRLDKPERQHVLVVFSLACVTVYLLHVGYLSLVKFDYGYNMMFGVIVGLLQNGFWTYHAFRTYFIVAETKTRHRHSHKYQVSWTLWPFFIVLAISLGMCFELFDFSPFFFSVDAHALWHAATIVPTYWWYAWMRRDMSYLKSLRDRRD